jgi:hypothetical protein
MGKWIAAIGLVAVIISGCASNDTNDEATIRAIANTYQMAGLPQNLWGEH